MSDFTQKEWSMFCDRVYQSSDYLADNDSGLKAEFQSAAKSIADAEPPANYADMLKRIAEAVSIIRKWQEKSPIESEATHLENA